MQITDLLPLDRHGLVTRRAACTAGLTDPDLRRLEREGRLVRLRRGVYVDAALWSQADPFRGQPLLRMRAAQLTICCENYVFSHDSAAIAQGLGVPDARQSLVHITHPQTHGDGQSAGVRHHSAPFRPDQVVHIDGLPVLSAPRTALDMAREHGLLAGTACCDSWLHNGGTMKELREVRDQMRSWRHSRVLDRCLDLTDAGAETWLESAGRLLVLSLGLGRPQTQFGLSHGGRTVWCDMRIGRHIVETDGRVKYQPEYTQGRDPGEVLWDEKKRQDFITGFKLGVSRLNTHDVRSGRDAAPARLLREYEDTCARFGTDISDLAAYRPCTPRRRGQP